ncbi:MAG: DegV family protein [Lachnospiraceae bacterium]|nr:DegV family protein [Lachnospiraceae bacterium]
MNDAKKTQIIIDSTTDLAEGFRDRVKVVPLMVSFGDKEYVDGIELSRDEFYRKLESGDVLPKTSQASPATFESVYREVREKGMNGIVITLSSELSGTYHSACVAAEDYPEICVVDSKNVAVGAGILAEYALICAEKGMPAEEIAEELEIKKNDICLIAMLDTLEYLWKGGRLSRTAAIAGGLLNLKPVITIKDGAVVVLGKARGAKKANNLLVEQIMLNGVQYNMPVLLGYSGTSDALLQNYISDSKALWEGHLDKLESSQICSVIGTHAGPGAVAVAFFKERITG